MSPALTEAIRKEAEHWIDAQPRTPDEVSAMLAGMKHRVTELTGEHRYRGLGFVPHECRHYDRDSFLAGRRLAEDLGIDPKLRQPVPPTGAPPYQAPVPDETWREALERYAGYAVFLWIIGFFVHRWLSG